MKNEPQGKKGNPKEANLNNWPPVEGRYEVGNKESPVALCTNRTIDEIEVNPEKVAIWGKCVTASVGIEKIIQNVVSNPNIRYLVLCGKASKGHFPAQAIEALVENGIDKDKKIIGAKGAMPFLKNIDQKMIDRFREQIKPVNIMGETDSQKIDKIIDKLLETKPEEFKAEAIEIKKIPEIEAESCPKWIPDPKGYFIISIDKKRNKIIAEHYNKEKELTDKIIGESADEISKTIANLDLIGDFEQTKEHSLYIGRELQKAEIALRNNLEYAQDSPLEINSENKQKGRNEYDFFD